VSKQVENEQGFTAEEQAMLDQAMEPYQRSRVCDIRDARRRREADEEMKEAWSASEAGQLLQQLSQAYVAYRDYMDRKPHLREFAEQADAQNQNIYDKLRANLERADRAPRCAYRKSNGDFCRAPKMRGKKFCCMHLALQAARPEKFTLPPLDDANAIQLAINKGAQGIVDGTLDQKQAGMLGYYLQLALSNVGRVDFEPEEETEQEEMEGDEELYEEAY
jgi:hypothetical protein